MKVLSIRCSNNDYTYYVVSGEKESPTIEDTGHVMFPAGFSDSEALRWFHQEMQVDISTYQVTSDERVMKAYNYPHFRNKVTAWATSFHCFAEGAPINLNLQLPDILKRARTI